MGNNLRSKTDYKEILYDLHIDLVQGHSMQLTKELCLSSSQIGISGEYIHSKKNDFCVIRYDLDT